MNRTMKSLQHTTTTTTTTRLFTPSYQYSAFSSSLASTNPSTVQASTVVRLQGSKPSAALCRVFRNSMELESSIFFPFISATRHPATLYHLGCRRGVCVCASFFSFMMRSSPLPQICPSFRLFDRRGKTLNENFTFEKRFLLLFLA